ncbi:hypothetical protein A2U01_0072998, partial [Trifolium medium]|nr:hypothetical protein [Trifolium medium]
MFTTGVLLWNGFNNQARNATALLPARIESPRPKRGNLPSALAPHKDWFQGHQGSILLRGNTPPRHSPPGSDEEDSRCPLSKEIMRAPIPAG